MIHMNPLDFATQQVKSLIIRAIQNAIAEEKLPESDLPAFVVEIPSDRSHGDFATNVAMVGAKSFRMAPVQIAQIIVECIDFSDSYFDHAEIAGPGFINFSLPQQWYIDVMETIQKKKETWGETDYGQGERVLVEFVSANPTGPMHLGNARGGVIGDTLASALNTAGYYAEREFYLNDAGNQIQKFGYSLEGRYLQHFQGKENVVFHEEWYQGADITERAEEYIAEFGDILLEKTPEERQKTLVDYVLPRNIEAMGKTLERYGIIYDTWFRESSIYADGTIDKILKLLDSRGYLYEKEGATWYKATALGAEKDEVLIRTNGNPTYFTADIAYHYNKFAVRNFHKCINVWGADHHGHVARIKGAMDAVGLDGNQLDIILMQLVRLMKNNEVFKMSKRDGTAVTLDDLLDLVSVDAARFFFTMRESNSAMDFDLDLAVEQSSKNPVFYVQYAHARICSIMKKATESGVEVQPCTRTEFSLLTHPSELSLIHALAEYPEVVIGVATRYDTASLPHHAMEIATKFHKFYDDCKVLVEEKDLCQARLALCNATRTTLSNLLGLLKITAPESM